MGIRISDEDVIFDAMIKGVFAEFCDLVILYGEDTLVELYKDENKAQRMIVRLQKLAKQKAQAQKRRALLASKEIENVNEYIKFLKGCFVQLDRDLKIQLTRVLSEDDHERAFADLEKKIELESKLLEKIIKEENKKGE